MLLAVFSDSHGNPGPMRRAIEKVHPDHIVFLGDGVRDAEEMEREYPAIPFLILRGNCDWQIDGHAESSLFTLEGVRIFAAHGHRHGVKLSREAFWNSVFCSGSSLGLYGHTHYPLIEEDEGRYLMNPGSVGDRLSPSFGLVTLRQGTFRCEIVQITRDF